MGVRILHDRTGGHAALYCSVSDWAFGPVFSDDDDASAGDKAECFDAWLPRDARRYTDAELAKKYSEWLALEKCWDHIAVKPCEKCQQDLEDAAEDKAERELENRG